WNREAETLSAVRRRALQLERLQAVVTWVQDRVPFYRDRLAATAVRTLEDLPNLPFTRKTDLREHYPFGLFAVPPAELVRIHASSGTKGKPTVVGYTRVDLDVWRERSWREPWWPPARGLATSSTMRSVTVFSPEVSAFTTAPSESAWRW